MAQSQIICDASAIGKTRVIRTQFWDRSHDFAPVAIFFGIVTPVAVPIFEIEIVRLLARFSPILGIPYTISDDLQCPPINRKRLPNNLRLVARFCVGLQIQVKIQCLRVVYGDRRLNRRRHATTHTVSVIVSDKSYGGIVVNRRVYTGASDLIAKSLRRSCCRRLWQVRKPSFLLKEKTLAYVVSNRLRCNRRPSEAHPTIFRQNLVTIL